MVVCALLSFVFYQRYGYRLGQKVQAVGNLIFTFNGLPPNAPVFAENDVKPGDCYTRPVTVENNGNTPAIITVKADGIQDPDQFSTVLNIIISHNTIPLYGDPTTKSVTDFFSDSNTTIEGYLLTTIPAGATHTYDFQVCLPPEIGNQWQRKQLVFDLVFGIDSANNTEIPPECRHIVGGFENVIYGTPNNDFLEGTGQNDLIFGMGGDDQIYSYAGDDCIVTLEGNDTIVSGNGHDVILAGAGDDTVDAGSGNDIVFAGPGNDTIYGMNGDDTLYGEAGNDHIDGGAGNDYLYGGPGNDSLLGGSGNDHLNGEDGTDSANGQSGIDYCLAETRLFCEAP